MAKNIFEAVEEGLPAVFITDYSKTQTFGKSPTNPDRRLKEIRLYNISGRKFAKCARAVREVLFGTKKRRK